MASFVRFFSFFTTHVNFGAFSISDYVKGPVSDTDAGGVTGMVGDNFNPFFFTNAYLGFIGIFGYITTFFFRTFTVVESFWEYAVAINKTAASNSVIRFMFSAFNIFCLCDGLSCEKVTRPKIFLFFSYGYVQTKHPGVE